MFHSAELFFFDFEYSGFSFDKKFNVTESSDRKDFKVVYCHTDSVIKPAKTPPRTLHL